MRVEFNRAIETRQRLASAPELIERVAFVGPGQRVVGIERERAVEAGEGFLVVFECLETRAFVHVLQRIEFRTLDRRGCGLACEQFADFRQPPPDIEERGEAARRFLGEARLHHVIQRGEMAFQHRRRRARVPARGFLPRLGGERQPPRGHLVKHHAERINVRPRVWCRRRIELLRRHVRVGAARDDRRRFHHVKQSGHAEVRHLERAVLGQQAVLRLDVEVRPDALAERVLHSVAKLDGEVQHLRQILRQSRRADPRAKVAAADVFEEEKGLAVDDLHGRGPRDVGMRVEVHPRAGFLFEPLGDGRVLREHLVPIRLGRARLAGDEVIDDVNRPHPALEDSMNLPAVLHEVADLPRLGHVFAARQTAHPAITRSEARGRSSKVKVQSSREEPKSKGQSPHPARGPRRQSLVLGPWRFS